MDETTTRIRKIDPKLRNVGWESVPGSAILYEQRAYIAPGRIVSEGASRHPKKADYILEYHGKKLAVIEAKSDEKDVSEGVAQAKLYAEMLQIRYTYACNGDRIWFIDMGVRDNDGNYIEPSIEKEVGAFPSPQELWLMTFPEKDEWRDRFNLCPTNRDGGKTTRYYQDIAINNVLNAIAQKRKRILLTMATGTGKTYTAFQICWKLNRTKWNNKGVDRQPKILFIADRNILANQARNDFDAFPEDSICRITPKDLRKEGYKVPTARNLYFTIFQTLTSSPTRQKLEEEGRMEEAEALTNDTPYFMQYPRDFFDFIIIDECHRGGANDESTWRRLMEYFDGAYQLGMTATPKRRVNANTYEYFGEPVYSYSLKQGIEDGFLVPFRVKISTSNIDTYQFQEGDIAGGDIDKDKTYTETDFYHGNIKIRERDEHRVKELLQQINPDDKTIVFCAKQEHALIVRDMINKHKRRPDSNYCVRVTSDDGEEGEALLRQFQNNDKLRPTILTTSHKLSTGVDARNVRNIVLMRPINDMVEFKQIIGRGTRLFTDKYYFTIYDFVQAYHKFEDSEWDGEPVCPKCGNWPCTCNKKPGGGGGDPTPHEPCPVCGHWPCTCDGGVKKKVIEVRLSDERRLMLHTDWNEKIAFGDRLVDVKEFIVLLFGKLSTFFKSADDLRARWSNPRSREVLLNMLEESGFSQDKLETARKLMAYDKCDLFDVLENIAYGETPIERAERVRMLREGYLQTLNKEQQRLDEKILECYMNGGFTELSMSNITAHLNLLYGTLIDARRRLGMNNDQIQQQYIELQKNLYYQKAPVIQQNIENHYHVNGSLNNITVNKQTVER